MPRRRGYPDFWYWDAKAQQLVFVEVKPAGEVPLRRDQEQFLCCARKMGARTYRWDPDLGFQEVP